MEAGSSKLEAMAMAAAAAAAARVANCYDLTVVRRSVRRPRNRSTEDFLRRKHRQRHAIHC